jgi:integrase
MGWSTYITKKSPMAPITREKYLTDTELVDIYTKMADLEADPRWVDPCHLVRLVLGAGLRVSEAMTLRIEDHCDPKGLITLEKTKHHMSKVRQTACMPEYLPYYQHRIATLKSGWMFPVNCARAKIRRIEYVPPPRGHESDDMIRVARSLNLEGFRRINLANSHFSVRTLKYWWEKVLRKAKVRRLSIHKGRHTYATWELASKRLTPYEIQGQLGHVCVELTLQIYIHAVAEMLYATEEPAWRKAALLGMRNFKET